MENISCNLCGSKDEKVVRIAHDYRYNQDTSFRIVKCKQCNLVYLNPRPAIREMHIYYPAEYHPASRRRMAQGNWLMRLGRRIVRQRRLPPMVGKKMLDIGCGSGFYLMDLRRMGWEVHGVEIDAEAAKYAREQYGLSVRTGAAEDALVDFADEQFDLVTMWHVLEHLFDPYRVLSEVQRILRPGGVLMVEVPNFDGLASSLFGEYWGYLDGPRHLYYFSSQTLAAMLAKAGFRLTRLKWSADPRGISSTLRVFKGRLSGDVKGFDLPHNPVLLALVYPFAWLTAQFRLSCELSAAATKRVE